MTNQVTTQYNASHSLRSKNPRPTRAASLTKPPSRNWPSQSAARAYCRPCSVRPIADYCFEIVAGARRYRAALLADAETVPVRIVPLTDGQALESAID